MQLKVVSVPRWPPWPLWACLLVAIWVALGSAVVCLSTQLHKPVQLCLFRALTGLPCLTCGTTRSVMSLLQGRFVQAWLYNPMMFSGMVMFFVATLARIVLGRSVRVHLNEPQRTLVWIAAAILLLSNWAYVILCGE